MRLDDQGKSLAEIVKNDVKAVVVDIEGTTTPITFVTEILFPYVKDNLETYLTNNWDKSDVNDDIDALRVLCKQDIADGTEDVPEILPADGDKDKVVESVVKNVHWQMSKDRKSTALKELQGHMWGFAYEDGSIKGEVYDDVTIVLETLKKDGKKLYVYSSGSVAAQKLLFEHSSKGDLCPLFTGYFDTKIGHKREAPSYTAIAESIKLKADKVLFLTDVFAEAEAAKEAKMKACIVVRPGNKELSVTEKEQFTTIKTFEDLLPDEPESKQQKTD